MFKKKPMMALCVIALAVLALYVGYGLAASSDEAVLGNSRWSVQNDGDLVPVTGSTYDIGQTGTTVANVYTDALTLGGVEITGVSALSTPMEDAGTYVQPIDGAGSVKLYDNGNVVITGGYTGDSIALENGAALANAVNNAVTLTENSDILTLSFTGNDVSIDSSDGGIIISLTDATDGTVDLMTNNDTDDYIQISTTTNQPLINFVGCNGKITAATGTIDFDNENLTTTGTLGSGATTVTSLIIGDDVYDVVTDDEFRFASNDSDSTIDAYGYEAKDGILRLTADQGDDNGDIWEITSNQSDNTLTIGNDTSGTVATKLTIAAATGNVTLTGDVVNENADTLVMSTDDTLAFLSNDEASRIQATGFEAKEAQLVLAADQDDDATDAWEIAASVSGTLTIGNDSGVAGTFVDKLTIDGATAAVTMAGDTLTLGDGEVISNATDDTVLIQSNDASFITKLYSPNTSNGTVSLQLVGDAGADATDGWQIQNPANGTLTIANDSAVAGTYVTKLTVAGSSGDVTLTGDIINENADSLLMDTDDVLVFSSNDENSDIRALGFEAKEARLTLLADQDDDATDGWEIAASTSGTLTIGNDSAVAGTFVDKVTVDSNGTATLTGGLIGGVQSLTTTSDDPGTGTANVTTLITLVTTDDTGTNPDTVTLGDGTTGQVKIINLLADTEAAGCAVTPTHFSGGTSILLEDAGDSVMLIFDGTNWAVVANNGGTIS